MQLQLPLSLTEQKRMVQSYRKRLDDLLMSDLDFHGLASNYASHNLHSFPAKFPPQLPRVFIEALTNKDDVILDPMMGSGTTLVEAALAGRHGVGFDIDPLAARLATVKTTCLNLEAVQKWGNQIVRNAKKTIEKNSSLLNKLLLTRWDEKTKDFIDFWFLPEVQKQLLALVIEIEQIPDDAIRLYFEIIFSSVIITKSGGVSLALDLGHTRPHRAKAIFDDDRNLIFGSDTYRKRKHLVKKYRAPIIEFEKRNKAGIATLQQLILYGGRPEIGVGDAQSLPLPNNSIDLIVTSPPYASNAIDYMRAHKFTLVWFDYLIDVLGQKRKEYIGGETIAKFEFDTLPQVVDDVISTISKADRKKGQVLRRYYSEMSRALREMHRILKPGKASIVVVGNSMMRGFDTKTQLCLAKIGETIGFEVPGIGVRNLDRNRRVLPATATPDMDSQIQQRMHEEYVIGFYKPVE